MLAKPKLSKPTASKQSFNLKKKKKKTLNTLKIQERPLV